MGISLTGLVNFVFTIQLRPPCAGESDAINTGIITKPVNPTTFSSSYVKGRARALRTSSLDTDLIAGKRESLMVQVLLPYEITEAIPELYFVRMVPSHP